MTKAERFEKLTCTKSLRADLRGNSIRAAAFTGISAICDFTVRLGSTAVLARLVLPEQFGLVMMVTAVTAIADQFRDLGLSGATVQKKEITHQEVTNLFWVNALAGTLITLVVCAISPLVSLYYKEPKLTIITCVLATNFLWGGLLVQHQALLTRQLRLGYTSAVRLGSSILSTALAIWLAWRGWGYWALVWREVARSLLLMIGMWSCFPWVPGLPSRKTSIRGLVGFGANLAGANIIGSVSAGYDRISIGRVWGAAPVAMYRQAYQLMVAPLDQLISPIYQVTQPGLSILQSEPERFRRFYRKVVMVVSMWTMSMSLFVAVYASEITRIMLGRKWTDAAPVLLILSFGAFIKQPVGSAAYVLITRGRSRMFLALTLLNNATLIILMTIGVKWGVAGVALADVVTTYLMAGPRLHYCFKDSPVTVKVFLAAIGRPAIASLAMAAVLLGLRTGMPLESVVTRMAVGCAAAPLAFLGAWLLLPGGREELAALVSDVGNALKRKRAAAKPPGPKPPGPNPPEPVPVAG
jgi:O-antigen/teichoic acid export membrane protein